MKYRVLCTHTHTHTPYMQLVGQVWVRCLTGSSSCWCLEPNLHGPAAASLWVHVHVDSQSGMLSLRTDGHLWIYCINLEIQPNTAKQRRWFWTSGGSSSSPMYPPQDCRVTTFAEDLLTCAAHLETRSTKVRSAIQCGVSTRILMCCRTCPDPEDRILVWWQLYTGPVRPPWDRHLHPNCWGYEFRGMMVKTERFPKVHWILLNQDLTWLLRWLNDGVRN